MNTPVFNKKPLHSGAYSDAPLVGQTGVRTDGQGRPVLTVNATQTVSASELDVRSLSAATDTVAATAQNFDIRSLLGTRDFVRLWQNASFVATGTQTLVLGGTVVLQADTAPYSRSAFLVVADLISLLTTASLQLAPVNTDSYYVTDSSQSGLILGGTYLFVPAVPVRYARIYATGIGSRLTAYYVGQA